MTLSIPAIVITWLSACLAVGAAAAYKGCVAEIRAASHVPDAQCTGLGYSVFLGVSGVTWLLTSLISIVLLWRIRRRPTGFRDPWVAASVTAIVAGIAAAPLFVLVVQPFSF